MINLNIYTDGACSGNPGKGGAAWVITILHPGIENVLQTGARAFRHTTNNRMELLAAIEGIRTASQLADKIKHETNPDENAILYVYTDSQIVFGLMNAYYRVKANRDLVETLHKAVAGAPCPVLFRKVQGHSGDTFNEQADRLAVEARTSPADSTQEIDYVYEHEHPFGETIATAATESSTEPVTLQSLLDAYRNDNDLCCAEFLATEKVPEGMSFEQAFQLYISMMKTVEGDRFLQIREKEIITL